MSDLRRRLIVVAGESSVLAGWLASDMGDSATARNFYETAMKAAAEADDPAIAACTLAYQSYIPSMKGANGRARVLLDRSTGKGLGGDIACDRRMDCGAACGRKRAGGRQRRRH